MSGLYHAHVYFDIAQLEIASQLHRELAARFGTFPGRVIPFPVGPHPQPMFQLVISADQLDEVVGWLALHRRGLDVLIHGVTGEDLKDHTEYASWLGKPHQLKLSMFLQSRVADKGR